MKGFNRVIALSITACYLVIFSEVGRCAEPMVQKAESLYMEGRYEESEIVANSLLVDTSIKDNTLKLRLYSLKARLAVAFERDEIIKRWLARIYDLDPNWKPNPYIDSPKTIATWLAISEEKSHESKPQAVSKNDNKEENVAENDGLSIKKFDKAVRKGTHFWLSLMPFGIGHFQNNKNEDGVFYLSSHILFLFLSSNRIGSEEYVDDRYRLDNRILKASGGVGIWGYELENLLPTLYEMNPSGAENVDYLLSFFPFGVGQKRNNQIIKAYAIAAIEVGGIAMMIHNKEEDKRNLGKYITLGGFVFGAYDAWLNHKWDRFQKKTTSVNLSPIIAPSNNNGGVTLGLNLKMTI